MSDRHVVPTQPSSSVFRHRSSLWSVFPVLVCLTAFAGAQEHEGIGPLRVTGVVPEPGRAVGEHVMLIFNRPIDPLKNEQGEPESPLVFPPPLESTAVYGENYVVVRFTESPKKGVFTALMHRDLKATDGSRFPEPPGPFYFSAEDYAPRSTWVVERGDGDVTLATVFPTAVDLQSLQANLKVVDTEGASVPVTVEAGENERTVRFTLPDAAERRPFQIVYSAGIRSTDGHLQSPAEVTHVYPPREYGALKVEACEWWVVMEGEQSVRLRFNEPVYPEAVGASLELLDISTTASRSLAFTAKRGADKEVNVHFQAPEPTDVKIRLKLPGTLRALSGASLGEDWQEELAVSTRLTIDHGYWVNADRDGYALMLRFSHPVRAGDLEQRLTIKPIVQGYHVEERWGNSVQIFGQWQPDTGYRIEIGEGLPFAEWARTPLPIEYASETPERFASWIGFAGDGRYYFPRSGADRLMLETRSVDEVTVFVHRLFPSNLGVAFREIRQGTGSLGFINRWCEKVGEEKVDIDSRGPNLAAAEIEVGSLLTGEQRGVFCLEARTEEGRSSTHIALLTNLGVLGHWQADQAGVFVHDLHSLAPLEGVRVTIWSEKNQPLGEGMTGADGVWMLDAFEAELGEPALALVEHGDDYTILELSPRNEDRREVRPWENPYKPDDYDGSLYADRDIYRPGETAHLRWIVRRQYTRAASGVPLLFEVDMPMSGRKMLSQPVMLSKWGAGGADFETVASNPTGVYRARLLVPGTEREVGAYTFHVEEFVPNRIRLDVSTPDAVWVPGGAREMARLQVEHLFGAPAGDRRTAVRLEFAAGYESEKWPGFQFGSDSPKVPDAIDLGEQTTDASGVAEYPVALNFSEPPTEPMRVRILGTAYEMGGRSVESSGSASLFPSPVVVGLQAQTSEDGVAGLGPDDVRLAVVAIGPDEEPAACVESVRVVLEEREWDYVVRSYRTHLEPQLSNRYSEVRGETVSLSSGRGAVTFPIPASGEFRVRALSPEGPQCAALHIWRWGDRVHVSGRGSTSMVRVNLDAEAYEPGETARLRIDSAFDGRAVVAVQGERIHRILTLSVRDGVAELPLDVSAEWYPNVWLSVTMVFPPAGAGEEVRPFSSFAAVPLMVRAPRHSLEIAMENLPEEIQPETTLTLQLAVRTAAGQAAPSAITLAAVDEGIHAITGYRNPAPQSYFERRRTCDLRRNHYYDRVAYDFEPPGVGGDGFLDEVGLRLGAPEENWIRTVALWTGELETGADGRVAASLFVPEFTGRLRFVAVAWNEDASGAAADDLPVRRPWMLRTSMPRFLRPGDSARCNALVFNTTAEPCRARVSWETGGALARAAGSREVDVAAGGEAFVVAEIGAAATSGAGEIAWRVEIVNASGDALETLEEIDPLPVQQAAVWQRRDETHVVQPGETLRLVDDSFEQDERAEVDVRVSASPALRLRNALEFVRGYPYGCLEQTVSSLMPLYLLGENEVLVDTGRAATDIQVRAGIERLFSMQTASGGLAAWPGSNTPYPYGSVYALHCLTLIENGRRYDLPKNGMGVLRKYVRGLMRDWSDASPSGVHLRAYAVFALALGGDAGAIDEVERYESVAKLPEPARYLLAAGLARNTPGDERVKLFLSRAPAQPWHVQESDGTLNSRLRNEAIRLIALHAMGAPPEETTPLVEELVRFVESTGGEGTTHEYGFALTALADILGAAAQQAGVTRGVVLGPDGLREEIQGRELFSGSHRGPAGTYEVANSGGVPLYVSVVRGGVPLNPATGALSEGVSVTRVLRDRDGDSVSEDALKHGESYRIELLIAPDYEVKNVVVSDLLPAGFEILNPRLSEEGERGAESGAVTEPQHLEIRDDRLIVVFDALGARTPDKAHRFVYAVNAVTPGAFRHPGTEAECMYRPAVRGRAASGAITIHPRD